MYKRVTLWYDAAGECRQVAVCLMENWDPVAEATEQVGPFDSPTEAVWRAEAVAINLASGQLPGQLRML